MTTIQLRKSIAFLFALIALSSFVSSSALAVKPPVGPTITQATGYLSNETLIITGTNLSGATVNVDDTNLVVTSNTSTTINADLPAGIGPGSYRLRVTTSGGLANMDLALDNGDLGNHNTTKGASALGSITTGVQNTAVGSNALLSNDTGDFNNAVGVFALTTNVDGNTNNAFGDSALLSNIHGANNTAIGDLALFFNDQTGNGTANHNTAVGATALFKNVDGSNNTAVGVSALSESTGDYNTALGAGAGTDPDIVSNNVYIGDPGFPGDENVISIGGIAASGTPYENTYIGGIFGTTVNAATALAVYVDTDGHLGTSLVDASGKKVRIRSPRAPSPKRNSMNSKNSKRGSRNWKARLRVSRQQ